MRARSQSGFTLLEVVVAFVLLSIVLSVVLEVFSTWLARTATLGERTQALALAQSKLAAVGLEDAVKEGETSGESADRRYRWTVRIVAHAKSDPGAPLQSTYSLYRAQSIVTWRGSDGREQAIELANLHLGARI